jgi:hypothetical protein
VLRFEHPDTSNREIKKGLAMMRYSVLAATIVSFPMAAAAVDGLIEINQNRALVGGVTPGDTPGFPVTITQAGSYRLTGNLNLPTTDTTGIRIESSEVSVDLNGFGVLAPGLCNGCPATGGCTGGSGIGILAVSPDVHVRNGIVRGMGSDGIQISFRGSVEGLATSFNGGHGINFPGGEGTVVRSNSHANGGRGVNIGGGGVVSGNRISCNADDGVNLARGTIVGNNILENGARGVRIVETGTVQDNGVEFNTGCGIVPNAATVANNGIRSNAGGGICATSSGAIIGNSLDSNGSAVSTGKALNLAFGVGFTNNVLSNHGCNTTAVSGGAEMGHNVCDTNGRSCTLPYCPGFEPVCNCIP